MALGAIRRSRKKVERASQRERVGRRFKLDADVFRTQVGTYRARVCPNRHRRAARCGVGFGRTPTAAVKSALRDLAKVLR